MIRNIGMFFTGLLIGCLGMGLTVYYLEGHLAMAMLPWILVAIAIILILELVLAWMVQNRKVHKLQKTAPAPSAQPMPKASIFNHKKQATAQPEPAASTPTYSAPASVTSTNSTSDYSTSILEPTDPVASSESALETSDTSTQNSSAQ